MKNEKIAVCITEHNRYDVFKECYKNIKKYLPEGAELIVVDDASDKPFKESTFRFENNVGIARAKNKCLELAAKSGAKHIFLFDSDCWPKTKDWYKPYIESKEPHFCYIFKDFVNMRLNDCILLYQDSNISAYSHARGCMLYFDQICMETIGGMDTAYKRWGYEHVDISNRIYNAGLTLFRYQDVANSSDLIYSMDEHQEVNSTVSIQERIPYLNEMKGYFQQSYESTKYCPYVDNVDKNLTSKGSENIILTCYFTGQIDPQRNTQWQANHAQLEALINSMNGQKLVILHDCFDMKDTENIKYVKVESSINPYHQRWLSYYQYLRDHPEVNKVFCVDATDVEMLKNPFGDMDSRSLYTGNEPIILWNNWMIANHRVAFILKFMKENAQQQLLNAGLLGGSRDVVMKFIHKMNQIYFDEKMNVGNADMGLFNYVARIYFSDNLIHGPQVNTRFKSYEKNNKTAWFKHK